MFSTALRRSAATLGVVTGLLAAAGPASAQTMPGNCGVTTPPPGTKAPASSTGSGGVLPRCTNDDVTAARMASRANGSAVPHMETNGDQLYLLDGGGITQTEPIELAVLDTGMFEHEWLKAATNAGEQMKDNVQSVVVLIGANHYGFAAEADGTQIGGEGRRPRAYTPPVGSNKGSIIAPIGSNKGSLTEPLGST